MREYKRCWTSTWWETSCRITSTASTATRTSSIESSRGNSHYNPYSVQLHVQYIIQKPRAEVWNFSIENVITIKMKHLKSTGWLQCPTQITEATEPSVNLKADASNLGCGGCIVKQDGKIPTGRNWSEREVRMHINCLKMLATLFTIKCFCGETKNSQAVLWQYHHSKLHQQSRGHQGSM